jgi:hypothetical protein
VIISIFTAHQPNTKKDETIAVSQILALGLDFTLRGQAVLLTVAFYLARCICLAFVLTEFIDLFLLLRSFWPPQKLLVSLPGGRQGSMAGTSCQPIQH